MKFEDRLERIEERIDPPTMLCVVLRRVAPIEDPGAIHPDHYYVGRYGVALFLGGSEEERRREVRRLRKSGEFDTPLGYSQSAIGEGTEDVPAIQGTAKAIGLDAPNSEA